MRHREKITTGEMPGIQSECNKNDALLRSAHAQSHRLASMLILSLIDSEGIQKSIMEDRLRHEKDGVRAWADLVSHFETSSRDLRIESLTKKWDCAELKAGEHPDKLWTKLTSINQRLSKLGEQFRDSHFIRRFVAGIKAQPGHPYKEVLTVYKGSVVAESPLTLNQLRQLLSEAYEDDKMVNPQDTGPMRGFIAIKSCDSINYLHFDAPCRAVEQRWLNNRCILNPGSGNDLRDLYERVSRLGRYKLMLDNADFNSAHTLATQKMVVYELFRGLEPAWRQWLVDSFDHMHVKNLDGEWCQVQGTLMSGHRMTSMINTVLNAAYIRYVVGEDAYNACHFTHVGDDVLGSSDDIHAITTVVERALAPSLVDNSHPLD